ncbi:MULTISPECIES: hypothetical protein [Catenuloplanes]|uniref:Uncharacterized protein n=1 Tax=Catenuloplanes niger TaxID=587534 RepID=A0AAE4CWK9_9ACTN|nr:hypothetical protein [Catenuloplanes niger]MDR7327325.1 hypothetical protein [Catenuloplanes niger]
MGCGCGCGCGGGCGGACGGAATRVGTAFVRPRWFAGMLLTEDDLRALTAYVSGKDRLHNSRLAGSGVVCGLEVACDPCGGGTVTVRPGYALDCAGHDIVVGCPEKVDVVALVNDLRVRQLGVDCGDPCGDRAFGLYARYTEERVEPISAYPTVDTCAPAGCEPSRVRETYRFVVKPVDDAAGHRYRPDVWLTARLGDEEKLSGLREQGWRLGVYGTAMRHATWTGARPIEFDAETADRFRDAVAVLGAAPETPSDAEVPDLVEQIRALGSALARLDTYPDADRDRIAGEAGVDLAEGRRVLGVGVAAVPRVAVERVWPARTRQQIALAVLDEGRRHADGPGDGLETRMLAQGLPLTYALRAALIADAHRMRRWLLGALESGDPADCGLLRAVESLTLPRPLPAEPSGDDATAGMTALTLLGRAAVTLGGALSRHVTDTATAAVRPPCADCADPDVLLAEVEVTDCEVVRVCATGREQVLPGGPGYAAWAPSVAEARELATRLGCGVLPPLPAPDGDDREPGDGPVALGYLAHLLSGPPAGDLDRLLRLLRHGSGPSDVDALRDEVAELSRRVDPGTDRSGVAELRGELAELARQGAAVGTLREQVAELARQNAAVATLRTEVARLSRPSADVETLRARVAELSDSRTEVEELRAQVAALSRPDAETAALREQVASLTRQIEALAAGAEAARAETTPDEAEAEPETTAPAKKTTPRRRGGGGTR